MSLPPSQARPEARPHLPVLDGIRGCAILLVMASHLATAVAPANAFDATVLGALQGGWIGVDLFFVLSGFLITGILLDSAGGPRYYVTFFARRALRILPLYWLFLALMACDAWFLRGAGEWAALMLSMPWHLAYLSNVLVSIGGWGAAAMQTGHLWSLAVEEQFYLTWPLLVSAIAARRLRGWMGRLLLYLPMVRGLALVGGVFAAAVHVLTPLRADSLGAGAMLALLYRDDDRARLLARLRVAGVASVAILIALVIGTGGLFYTNGWTQTIGYTALALAFAALIDHALRAPPRSATASTLGNPLLRSFGRYSYSIYLFHAPILLTLDGTSVRRGGLPTVAGSRLPAFAAFAAGFALLMWLIGFTTWWTFEERILRLKRHFSYLPATAATAASPPAARAASPAGATRALHGTS